MLFGSAVLLVYTGLIWNIEAIGPVVSNNEWTPVVNSQRVYLSPEVLAKYRQAEREETAQERYDVVDNGNNNPIYTEERPEEEIEVVTEPEVIIIQEEQKFESQKVKNDEESRVQPKLPAEQVEEEPKPIIVYPEGTISGESGGQTGNGYDDRPAPVYPSAQPQQPQYAPRPPPQNRPPPRRPLRPPPSNLRPRPPPPGPPPKYLPALSRNAYPPQEEGDQPRPRPPVRPPPRGPARRPPGPPPPRRPKPSRPGLIDKIKCKAVDLGSDLRLQDENFVRTQLDCVLGEGPCDELGAEIKRMAPDILRGICPPPCDECKKKQIQKVMSTIARKYPKEWSQMVQRHVGRR